MSERHEQRNSAKPARKAALAFVAFLAAGCDEQKPGIPYSGPWNGGQTERVVPPDEAAKNAFSADCVIVDGNTHKARKGELSESDDPADARTVSRENLDSKCFKK